MAKKKPEPKLVREILPAQFIRQHLLRMSVNDLAAKLKLAPSIVSRYNYFPEHHRPVIDAMAAERGIGVAPSWHEKVPFHSSVPDVE